ncbi:MAG: BMP family ABC transporter substrate-binding protein [Bacillota bacterium]|nr:BMP family ABC transporter substrate-binding protein [Bacillota bacterium]
MKKRILILLLVLPFVLTACTQGKITYVGDSPNVALLIAKRGDMNFNDSAIIGLKKSEHDHGTVLTVLEHNNQAENYEKVFLEAAKGYNHVIMMSSMMKGTLEKHAADYPDVKFLMYDGEVDWSKGNLKNVYCIVYRANEAAYLAGYLAASMSETNKIGFVGGIENDNIRDFAVGYLKGARHKNPDIQIDVKYAQSFSDAEKGKEIARGMVDNGADIIFAAAGGVNTGVLEVLAEKNRWMIGVDCDQYANFMAANQKHLAKHILTSVTKDISGALYQAIDNYTKREVITGETKTVGLKEGGVSLAKNNYYQQMVPQDVQNEINDLEQKIAAGEVAVPSVRTLTPEEIQALIDSVRPK